jgi:uncharacterized protein YbbK (DUF523 family)
VAEIITRTVPLGISACVFSCPVRYNGKAFDALKVLGREKADFAWTPVCPECLAGLGVPRTPVHLTGPGEEVLAGRAKVLDRRGRDVTDAVLEGSRCAMSALERAGVRAFVAKESSPSCGLYKAQVGKQRTATKGSGVFGALLIKSGRFLIPDEGLANSLSWWDWRRRLLAWLWLSDREIASSADLYDAWHTVKFVIQETNRPFADDMGRRLAALPKGASAEALEPLRAEMLEALRAPSTKPRMRQALYKTWAQASKSGKLYGVDTHGVHIASPEGRASVDEVARDLIALERIGFENDLLFGTSPVIRRDRRRVVALEREQEPGQPRVSERPRPGRTAAPQRKDT